MSGHAVDDERLIAYANDELGGDEAAIVAAHVAGCAGCAATVARCRMVRAMLYADDSVPPPAAAVARAKGLFGEWRRANASVASRDPLAPLRRAVDDLAAPLRRVVAELTFDSRAALGAGLGFAGVRGGAGAGYQLAYESGAGEVDVQVEPLAGAATEWRLLGQVGLVEATPGVRVALTPLGSDSPVVEAEADEHGVFDVAAMPGKYDLTIRLPAALLVLPGLEVG